MKRNFTKILAAFALLVFMAPSLVAWGQTTTTLFHETFGNNTGSAREWDDAYSVKSGIAAVYSDVNYTMTNLKQGKNTTGYVQSGLNQSTSGTDASFEFGPLHVADYSNLSLDYYWKAASIKATYSTSIYYKTSVDGDYSEITHSAQGATTFVEVNVVLPEAAQTNTLYLKIVWNTSNTQAIIDEVDLQGVPAGGGTTTYTVTYDGNGADQGTVPTDNNEYESGEVVTVLGNTGNLAKTGNTWVCWNTTVDGTGTNYEEDDTFEISGNTTLYAKWNVNTYNVTMPAGDQYGTYTMDATNPVAYGTTVNLTYTPATGYEGYTASWTVNGEPITGSSFTMPDEAVTVGVTVAAYVQPTEIEITPNFTFWGKTAQFSGDTYSELSGSLDNVSLNWTRGTGSMYANQSAMRFYKDNTLTFTAPEGYEITSIELTVSGTYSDLVFSPTGYDNTNTTWTGAAETVTMSRPSNASSYATISKFTITLAAIGNAVTTTTTINVPQNFNTDIHQGTNAGTLTATVTAEGNTISGATVTWSSSDETVATINANGAVTLVAVGTTTITANYAGVDGEYRPSSGTYELTVTDSNAPGTQNNPYTVAQARAAIDAGIGTQGVYATGIVCTASNNLYSGKYLSYYISDDGTETDRLEAYNGLGLNGANFTSVNDVQVGATVVIYGNLTKYNQTYEFAADNYLVSYTAPVITDPFITVTPSTITATVEGGNGTLSVTYENITEIDAEVYFCNAQGSTATYDWISASINSENNVAYTISANDGAARMAYLKVKVGETFSNLVTITQAAYMAPFEGGTYQLATSIESGNIYIITSEPLVDEVYAMGADRGNNRGSVSVSIDETTVTVEPDQEVYEFVITILDDPQGFYSIYDPRNAGYLYAAGGTSSNYLKTKAELDNKGQWTITFGENNKASIVANFGNEKAGEPRNTMRFNSTNNPPIFSCYATDGQSDVYLYKKVEASPVTETHTLTITGYTDVTEGTNNKGYYLIASPVTVDPATVEGMTTGDFDLYYFDDSQDDEWINYKADDNGAINNFNLVPGKGYLYAKKATAETPSYSFNLTGAPYTGTGEIPVAAGWNLIGNPFGVEAEISSDYYALTYESNELIATTAATHVAAMQGVFVNADKDDTVIFEAVENNTPGKGQNIALNLSKATRGASTIDRAIVRFDEGQQLPKFQLFENSTKLYIPQGNKDFAIVRSAAEGEMPVNFRASENGTYTLSIETENVEMNYLHLIDNMTGADVDLLATPNYTFEARTNDYTSRFRLVFSAEENGASTDSATFAYFNGTSWTVSNTGDATLQVVDITGRIVSSETINGNATVSLNQPAGIYMLRLVNGNDVKVQKVVVR